MRSDRELVRDKRQCVILGAPEQVRAQISTLVHESGAEEVLIETMTHDFEARKRSYALIGEALLR
jgi:alkanesulfonate monooxygenase SsuD/methylene tetrahydromethanopterin reductase-like flavin-dependent oxidoreductase (luciferase family)